VGRLERRDYVPQPSARASGYDNIGRSRLRSGDYDKVRQGEFVNDTWSHAAARTLVRPLVGTWVRPNHLTLLRLLTGVLACVLLARGGGRGELWSGILGLLSAFLDRADGELARVGSMQSRAGHLFDYYTDVALNSAFFLAAGINLHNAGAGNWSIAAGIVACAAMLACCLLAEAYESEVASGERVWEGGWGFQPDDALYLLPLFVWLHWLVPILAAAAVVTSVIALILFAKYVHVTRSARRRDRVSPLGDDGVRQYADKGWASVPGFFSAAEVAEMSAWVDDLSGRPERPGAHMVYHEEKVDDASVRLVQRIENFCPFHPGLDDLVNGRLKASVERLLGGAAVLFKDKINFKMPGGAGFEAHQDQQAGWSRYAPLFITALVCIDPATVENGCLEIADAPRFTGLIGEEWKPLTSAQMAGFELTPLKCSPGDVIFFDSYVPHASKPNGTDRARRILYLTYNAKTYGDHRVQYFAEKRANFPPDIERKPGTQYRFRV
jgi:phosphatidylglycerophosphate synthase